MKLVEVFSKKYYVLAVSYKLRSTVAKEVRLHRKYFAVIFWTSSRFLLELID